jgi:hypothetical protein
MVISPPNPPEGEIWTSPPCGGPGGAGGVAVAEMKAVGVGVAIEVGVSVGTGVRVSVGDGTTVGVAVERGREVGVGVNVGPIWQADRTRWIKRPMSCSDLFKIEPFPLDDSSAYERKTIAPLPSFVKGFLGLSAIFFMIFPEASRRLQQDSSLELSDDFVQKYSS